MDRPLLGSRILVPLGRRKVTAIATALCDAAPSGIVCKDVAAVLDEQPILTEELLRLVDWMAGYYVASRAEVLSLVVPRGLTSTSQRILTLGDGEPRGETERAVVAYVRTAGAECVLSELKRALRPTSVDAAIKKLVARGVLVSRERIDAPQVRPRTERFVELVGKPDEDQLDDLFRRAHKRRQIYEYLLGCPRLRASVAELAELFPHPQPQIAELERAGVLNRIDLEVYRGIPVEPEVGAAPTLTAAQEGALAGVTGALGGFATILLQGVTASGKTEVYLRAIARVLERDQDALVLVPEISLTHQIVARLVGRFGDTVAVLHSELSAGERWDEWRRIRRREARIVVGARSAVLAPIDRLGIIVVDEEHDPAYKQEDGVRYHGRDIASTRAAGDLPDRARLGDSLDRDLARGARGPLSARRAARPSHGRRPSARGGRGSARTRHRGHRGNFRVPRRVYAQQSGGTRSNAVVPQSPRLRVESAVLLLRRHRRMRQLQRRNDAAPRSATLALPSLRREPPDPGTLPCVQGGRTGFTGDRNPEARSHRSLGAPRCARRTSRPRHRVQTRSHPRDPRRRGARDRSTC